MAIGYTYSNGTNGVYATGTYTIDPGSFYVTTTATLHTTEGSKESKMNVYITTVRTKAGWLGQVIHGGQRDVLQRAEADQPILWESKPKKTAEKARKAAEKAQLEAARSTFDWIEA